MNLEWSKQREDLRRREEEPYFKYSVQEIGRDHTLRFCLESLVGGQGSFEEEELCSYGVRNMCRQE